MAEKALGIGIVGCGRVTARRMAPAIVESDLARLVAFCSRNRNRARQFAEQFGPADAYDDLDAFLADDRIEAVYLATPNHLHAEQARRCLAAGKHVLSDKPLAPSSAEVEDMIDAARRARRILGVLHQQRFHPGNVHLQHLIATGWLGKLNLLRIQVGFWYPPGPNWRLNRDLSGGGPVIDLGPHALDVMLQCAGPVASVDARTDNLQFDYGVEDFCAARLAFAGGAIGLLELSYCFHHYGGRVEAFGSEGTHLVDGSMQTVENYQTWMRRGEWAEPVETAESPNCYRAAVDDFAQAVLDGREPCVTMYDGLRVMKIIEAIYDSAKSRSPVQIEPRVTSPEALR